MSSSSVASRRFDPKPDPQAQGCTTINGDKRLTMSAYPDLSYFHPATGFPEDFIAWYRDFEAGICAVQEDLP